jgi:hypothetical protein
VCGDDDMPVAGAGPAGFNLYQVNGCEHCLTLTNDPEVAIGVVLAWMDEE